MMGKNDVRPSGLSSLRDGAAEASPPKASIPDAVAEALEEYNSVLRTACTIAERKGKNTAWESYHRNVKTVLERHHATWLEYSSFRRLQAQAIEARKGGDAQQAPSSDESAVHATKHPQESNQ